MSASSQAEDTRRNAATTAHSLFYTHSLSPADAAAAPAPTAAPLIAPPVPVDAPEPVVSATEPAADKPKVKEPKSALYGDAPADAAAADPVHPQTGKKLSNAAIGGIIAGAAVGAAALAGITLWATTRGKGADAGEFSTS